MLGEIYRHEHNTIVSVGKLAESRRSENLSIFDDSEGEREVILSYSYPNSRCDYGLRKIHVLKRCGDALGFEQLFEVTGSLEGVDGNGAETVIHSRYKRNGCVGNVEEMKRRRRREETERMMLLFQGLNLYPAP